MKETPLRPEIGAPAEGPCGFRHGEDGAGDRRFREGVIG